MRILFLVHRIPYPPNKGDKIRSFAELRALAGNNEVDVFCFYDDPQDIVSVEGLRPYCKSCYAEPINPLQARIRALLAVARGRSFTLDYYASASMRQRVRAALESSKYDCIMVFSSSMVQYAINSGVPSIVDLVDVDSDKWIQYARHHNLLTRWMWRREGELLAEYEREITQQAQSVLLCTEPETEILRSIAPNARNIYCVPNALDLQFWNTSGTTVSDDLRSRAPYVIFPGQMDYYPNIEAAVRFREEVMPLLRQDVPEAKFVIAGRNPSKAVRRLSADPAVWVTGAVPDMRPLLAGAAAAVIPLRIARGVQNKILECLAMGVPVVCSAKAAAALPSAVAELLKIVDDPPAVAATLCQIIRGGHRIAMDQVRLVLEKEFGFAALKRSIGELTRMAAAPSREMREVEVQ